MPFFTQSDFFDKEIFKGVTIHAVGGQKVMMSFVDFQPNSTVEEHSHPHEQMGTVLEGEFELRVGDERKLVRKGDCYLVPGGVPHSARSFSAPARALDVFGPPREDYRK